MSSHVSFCRLITSVLLKLITSSRLHSRSRFSFSCALAKSEGPTVVVLVSYQNKGTTLILSSNLGPSTVKEI